MFPNGYNMPFNPYYGNIGFNTASRSGFLSKLTGLRSINWQGILNNTSRTLGVINQAIPIVKQVGPMYNNMKSMLKIASLFKDETDLDNRNDKTNNNLNVINNNKANNDNNNNNKNTIIKTNYSNTPNFFI